MMKETLLHALQPLLLASGFTTLLFGAGTSVAKDWQEKMLFSPTQAQLKMEQRGRVMIYSDLTDKQVEEAMDTQFDRIHSMMFVRTIVTDDRGAALRDKASNQVIVEDDGCD